MRVKQQWAENPVPDVTCLLTFRLMRQEPTLCNPQPQVGKHAKQAVIRSAHAIHHFSARRWRAPVQASILPAPASLLQLSSAIKKREYESRRCTCRLQIEGAIFAVLLAREFGPSRMIAVCEEAKYMIPSARPVIQFILMNPFD